MIWKYVFCGASDYEALLEEAISEMPTVEVFLDDKLEEVHKEGEEPTQEEFERIDQHLTRMGYEEDMVYITRHKYII